MPTRTPPKPSKPRRPAPDSPQAVRLAGETFIILPEREYLRLRVEAGELTRQDIGDIAEAKRRLADPNEKPIPYTQARKQLGLT